MFSLPCFNTPFLDDGKSARVPVGSSSDGAEFSALLFSKDIVIIRFSDHVSCFCASGNYIMLSKNSMVLESSVRVTMAFFHSEV